MVTDPRFDVYPEEFSETQRRRSKWTSCLIGCLIVLGALLVFAIVVGVWVSRNWRDWFADVGTRALDQGIQAADLPPQEKIEVKVQVDRVTEAFRDGTVSGEQIAMIMQNVFESPLMPALVAAAIDMRYFDKSGLNAEEKAQGKVTLQRFARGMIDEKIAQQGIDAVMAHVAIRQSDGEWKLRQQVSDADLRAALTEAKAQADKAGIPEAPENVDPSDEIKKIIDEAMQAPAG
jgi:hypothetical protein